MLKVVAEQREQRERESYYTESSRGVTWRSSEKPESCREPKKLESKSQSQSQSQRARARARAEEPELEPRARAKSQS